MLAKLKKYGMLGLVAALLTTVGLTGKIAPASAANANQVVYEMGAGWNLGNSLEASVDGVPSETAWNNPTVTKDLIKKVKASGFKTIRIPISYLNKIGSAPNYTVDGAWLDRIKTVVDYAHSEGLYVIINIHGDGYNSVQGSWLLVNDWNQNEIKVKFEKVWQQISLKFKDYNDLLIFESMNEVFDGQYGNPNPAYYANLNVYNQIFIDTVRKTGGNNSARWLLVPGWNTNIDFTAGNYGFVIPSDNFRSNIIPGNEKRIMISAHYYSPWDFAGEENGNITQWGATSTNPAKKSNWGQEDYLNAQFKMMYDKFVTLGYPVIIGEFGSIDKTSHDSNNNKYREAYAKVVTSTAKKYTLVPVYWDNGFNGQYGFGLFNRYNNTVTQQGIINAIMQGMQ